jgi:hypothetical protein
LSHILTKRNSNAKWREGGFGREFDGRGAVILRNSPFVIILQNRPF